LINFVLDRIANSNVNIDTSVDTIVEISKPIVAMEERIINSLYYLDDLSFIKRLLDLGLIQPLVNNSSSKSSSKPTDNLFDKLCSGLYLIKLDDINIMPMTKIKYTYKVSYDDRTIYNRKTKFDSNDIMYLQIQKLFNILLSYGLHPTMQHLISCIRSDNLFCFILIFNRLSMTNNLTVKDLFDDSSNSTDDNSYDITNASKIMTYLLNNYQFDISFYDELLHGIFEQTEPCESYFLFVLQHYCQFDGSINELYLHISRLIDYIMTDHKDDQIDDRLDNKDDYLLNLRIYQDNVLNFHT
jgi:hypothetical protein